MKSYLLTFLFAFLLAGCSIMEDGDVCPDTEESDYINLSFRLTAMLPGGGSRVEEISSEYAEFEDRIYADKFAFYIYAGTDGSESLLMKLMDMSVDNITTNTNDPHTSLSGGPTNFTLKVSVSRADFEAVVPSTETDGNINFRIVVFANTDTENTVKKLSPSQEATSTTLLIEASKWTYNILGTLYADSTTDGELLSDAAIPMYGIRDFTLTRSELYKSKPYAPVYGGPISLLRSIAKIKVIDNYSNPDGETSAPFIATVTFKSSTNNAYILPNDAPKYVNGDQVTSPNLCSGEQTTITLLKQDNSWIGYIPEQKITKDIGFTIKINSETKDFFVPMTEYEGQKLDFGDAILRNHIYTLSVNKIESQLDITATVKEWVKKELTLDYTATPSVTQKLIWDPASRESYDTETGVVIVKPASTVESIVPVKGDFVLNTPAGATWHAFLIPSTGNGNPYAFQFKDKDNYVSSLSGTVVPGKKIDIEIYPRIVEPEENNEVLLQIVVTLGNGNVIEVPVTPDGKSYKNFTILQNKQ